LLTLPVPFTNYRDSLLAGVKVALILAVTACSLLLSSRTDARETIHVSIKGIKGELSRNVRHHLSLTGLPCDAGEPSVNSALRRAQNEISAGLRALGYYQGTWQTEYQAAENKNGDDCWRVTIRVDPGKPAVVELVDLDLQGEARTDPEFQSLLSTIAIEPGQQVDHGKYEAAKKTLRQRATHYGYFDAQFIASELKVNTETNTASVTLVFDSGRRSHFGAIHLPDVPLEKSLLQSYQTFRPGDPYDAEKLINFQNNLINSQYFESVFINPSEPDANGEIEITVDLTLKSIYESIFGAGFSTDIGPRVNYTLKNRRFSSDGKQYEFSSLWSPVQQRMGIQLTKPGEDPIHDKTIWSLGWQKEDTDTSKTESYLAEVSRLTLLDNGWTLTRSLSLLAEEYDISDRSDFSTLLYPGVRLSRSQANHPAYPTKGWRLTAGVKGGVEKIVSDTSFAQATVAAKGILPLFGGRMIGRTGLGATFADNFNAIPATLRFFAGGDNSIRGFDYQSLGPRDSKDKVVGGKHLATASIEYDHRVYEDYSAALFFDTGSAFDNSEFTFYESVGIGARWLSPIGPIRLDFAFPLDGGFRLHLSMGPDL
jgi:translocation and assembly module TamA